MGGKAGRFRGAGGVTERGLMSSAGPRGCPLLPLIKRAALEGTGQGGGQYLEEHRPRGCLEAKGDPPAPCAESQCSLSLEFSPTLFHHCPKPTLCFQPRV